MTCSRREMDAPVIVLNWNGWDDTLACLRSLRAAPDVREVWLVDNASREDRTAEAAAVYPGLRVLRWEENLGYAGGNNRALRQAAAEGRRYAYLLNNDCEARPGFLAAVLAAAEAEPRLAAVGSMVAYAEPEGYLEYDGELHPPGARPLSEGREVRRARVVSGAGFLVRLAALERDGYFDERLFCYGEELELCLRLARAGWGVAAAEASRVVHHGCGSDVSANRLYYTTRNRFLWLDQVAREHRTAARSGAIYRGVVAATTARQAGDQEQWAAVVSGLRDGLARRFGRRHPDPVGKEFLLRVRVWALRARIRDKWRLLRGLPPGFPPIETYMQ